MKFIDELDVERVNQTLNFETSDCKITGGCDIFTTKPVASDKKLYKRIDNHLETLLQENEGYNAALQQQAGLESNGSLSPDSVEPAQSAWDKDSFWEQKRRMSVNDNGSPTGFLSSGNMKSNKLNDQNLKELVQSTDSNYLSSSSSGESNSRSTNQTRRTSSSTGPQPSKTMFNRRRSSAVNEQGSINIGPFGPINETASRRTFAYLIAILNASFPDHDFSSLEPTDFLKVSLKSMISKFENSLYSLGKKPEEWMWEVINSHMDISDCVIYQYSPSRSFLDDEPGCLWSLIWFLFNKKRKRVAYLYLISSRLETSTTAQSNVNEDDERAKIRQKKKTIIDDGACDCEGEYDLAYDENAIEDDGDDAVEVAG
ncbi:MAF1 (YDR005C) [Zygosaccharomyces parabailii]|nr:MAF1 (YDR005C) [Zygosaccharomyces parabailii]